MLRRILAATMIGALALTSGCAFHNPFAKKAEPVTYESVVQSELSPEEKVDKLVANMSDADKVGQLLMIELMAIFGGRILHSFSIFSLILAVLLWGEMFALKQNLNEYFMCKEGKSYGISIIGKGRIAVSVAQSILLIFLGISSW